MKTTKRKLSFLLAVVMSISLITGMQFTALAAEPTSDVNTEPVFIDMSSAKTAGEYLAVNAFPPNDTRIEGNHEFDADEGALSLLKTAANGNLYCGNMKYTVKFNSGNMIEGRPYMVVKYKTNITGNTPLILNNYQGAAAQHSVTVASNVSVSGGEYVYSKPVNIKTDLPLNSGKTACHYARFMDAGYHNVFALNTAQADAYFYIKEIAFFATEAEANDYALTPLVIDMSSQAAASKYLRFDTFQPDTVKNEGYYTFDANEKALSLLHTSNYIISGNKPQGTMRYSIHPNRSNLLDGRKYIVVTYKTDIGTSLPLNIGNFWGHLRQLTSNVRVSGDEYVRTEPVFLDVFESGTSVNSNYYRRMNTNALQLLISVNMPTAGKHLYIKEIAFFASPEQAYKHYGVEPMVVDMSSKEAAGEHLDVDEFGPNNAGTVNGNYEFNAKEGALSLLYSNQAYGGRFKYTVRMKGGNTLYGNKWMVVTYRTDITENIPLNLDNFNSIPTPIVPDVSVSNGKYVRSAPVNINTLWNPWDASYATRDYYGRFNELVSSPHNLIWVKPTDTDCYFYIKEIAFFQSPEEAEEYYRYTPVPRVDEEKGIPNSGLVMMLLAKRQSESGDAMRGTSTVIDYSSKAAAEEKIVTIQADNGVNGTVEFDETEGALSVRYTDSGDMAAYGGRVKYTLKLKTPDVIAEDQVYMVVTYKTDITEKVPLRLGNFNDGYLTLAADVTVSDGKYVRTAPLNIDVLDAPNTNYHDRLRSEKFHDFICVDTKESDKSFFIKEIAFFSDLNDAKAYARENIK